MIIARIIKEIIWRKIIIEWGTMNLPKPTTQVLLFHIAFMICVIYLFSLSVDVVSLGFFAVLFMFFTHLFCVIHYRKKYINCLFHVLLEEPNTEGFPWKHILGIVFLVLPPLVAGGFSGYIVPLKTWAYYADDMIVALGVVYAGKLFRNNTLVSPVNVIRSNETMEKMQEKMQKKQQAEMQQFMLRINHMFNFFVLGLIGVFIALKVWSNEKIMTTAVESAIAKIKEIATAPIKGICGGIKDIFPSTKDNCRAILDADILPIVSAAIGFGLIFTLMSIGMSALVFNHRMIAMHTHGT